MKKIIRQFILITMIIITTTKVHAIDINSNNAIMYNLNDDKIIYEKNSKEQVKIASLTKIMTAILTIENVNDIKEKITMPIEAYNGLNGYVTSGIKPNETVTYEDLLYGIMLPSGADCANAVAILTTGSVENFVNKMNEKAKELNMNNTHFSNTIGKDEENYSSVEDVAALLKYALKNEEFYKIFTTRNYTTTNNIKFESTIITKSEKLKLNTTNIKGSKTGFTDEAGNCLASIAEINNIKYLLVTVKASTQAPYQIIDAINLYDYFSKNFSYKKILNFNQTLEKIKIKNIIEEEYEIKSNNDLYLYLNNEIKEENIKYEYVGETTINKKYKKGDQLGKINIKYNNEILSVYDVYLEKNIKDYNYIIISSIIFIIILTILTIINKKIKKKTV